MHIVRDVSCPFPTTIGTNAHHDQLHQYANGGGIVFVEICHKKVIN